MISEDIKRLISKAEGGDTEAMYTLAVNYRDGHGVKQDFERFLHWLMCLRKRFGFGARIKSILSFQNRPESELKSFVAWVQDSAASGSVVSMNYLTALYHEGIGLEKDLTQFIEWLRKAIAAGDAQSMGNLARAYKEGKGVEKDLTQYIEWLRKAIAAGDVRAMGNLAWAYKEGEGVEKDLTQYIEWLRKAIAAGDVRAMGNLAWAYKEGEGVEKDLTQYIEWLRKAIAAGDVWSMGEMAWAYKEGEGVEKDLTQYIEWLHKAIAAGDIQSMGILAWVYRKGIGVEKDLTQYIEWLRKAIAAGDARSMGNLAWAYKEGEGVEKDLTQYIEWLRKAIAAGNAWSMGNLAWAYKEGEGVEKDLTQYIEWLRKAIAAGDVWSMRNLAMDYRDGVGVDIDSQQSMYWFSRAAENGDEYALDEIRRLYQSRQFETDNRDANIIWLTQAIVIEDTNLFVELALKYRERNQAGDDKNFYHWLQKAENLGNITAFILQSLDRAQQLGTLDESIINSLTNALFELNRKVEEIKQQHLISDDDQDVIHVAHFTTLEALHSMLPVGEESHAGETCLLRLYNIAYMNDPQEGRRLRDIEHENSKLLNQFFTATEQGNNHNFLWEGQEVSVYCGSFTLRVDRLDLWRAYGRDGLGYCLVIPSKTFQQEYKSNPRRLVHDALRREEESYSVEKVDQKKIPALYRIRYKQGEAEETLATLSQSLNKLHQIKQQVNDELSKQINAYVRIIISDILYLYKNEEYASEEEARMIVAHNIMDKVLKLDDRQPPHIYVETDAFLFRDTGTRIIIGPKVADKVAAELNLKYRLARHGLLKTTFIEWSKVKYR